MLKKEVIIHRQDCRYPVFFLYEDSTVQLKKIFGKLGKQVERPRKVCLMVDSGFAKVRPGLIQNLKSVFSRSEILLITVPSSESSKSWSFANGVLAKMIKKSFDRSDLCVAVGGGVVGDLAGFVASLYHRGIGLIHIPTTLLSMVDSSIGGKTAVNHALGKNQIGTFYQPLAVIELLPLVQSLPEKDYLSGLGEVFKYACGFSSALFSYLDRNATLILERDADALAHVISQCVAIKSRTVRWDERETGISKKSDRRLLNLGHTLGHALEKELRLPHGVAVAVGVTLAAKLSVKLGHCSEETYDRMIRLASKLSLKTHFDVKWKMKDLLRYLLRDKKRKGNQVYFVLLKKAGFAFVKPLTMKDIALAEES